MSIPLRVLFVEDTEHDLAMLLTYFARSEYALTYRCVDSAEDMAGALAEESWDLIISDYCMPGFSGIEALGLMQQAHLDCPFIIVSGNIGEETAVAAMKAGAHDYIFKGNLQRLLPAVTRELREAAVRREHQATKQVLRQTESRYRSLVEQIPATVYWTDSAHPLEIQYVSPQAAQLLGMARDEVSAARHDLRSCIHADDRERVCSTIADAIGQGHPYHLEYRLHRADGSTVWVLDTAETMSGGDDDQPHFVQGIMLDISRQKSMEAALRNRECQLRALASEMSLAEERERRRLATALHDEISQTLAFARMELRAAMTAQDSTTMPARLERVWTFVDQAYQQTKSLTFEFSPPILYDLGLPAAIDWLAEEFESQHGLSITRDSVVELPPIPSEIAMVLFRATRELLTNIVKHARARSVSILVEADGDSVRICVADNGVGCDVSRIMTPAAGHPTTFGLLNLRERLHYLGGELTMASVPDEGTRVEMTLPVAATRDAVQGGIHGVESSYCG